MKEFKFNTREVFLNRDLFVAKKYALKYKKEPLEDGTIEVSVFFPNEDIEREFLENYNRLK